MQKKTTLFISDQFHICGTEIDSGGNDMQALCLGRHNHLIKVDILKQKLVGCKFPIIQFNAQTR